MPAKEERIVLGSGKLYVTEYEKAIPEDGVIEVKENLLGLISGGATLEYKPEFYEAKDDLGIRKKTILTKEEATLKSGIMTWNGNTLKKMCSTARVTDVAATSSAPGKRVVKIGGASNQDGKNYLFRFVQEDEEDGDIRVTVVGKNQSGFTLAFVKDKETIIDAEVSAMPLDDEGTLIIFEEETEPATAPSA